METNTFLPHPGTTLVGRFELRELVGVGPISGVFKAIDKALGRDVVVKYFFPGMATPPVKDINLFRLYRARGFLHPNLVTVQEVVVTPNEFFITKDVIDGISLRALQRLRQENLEPFNKKEIVALLFEICEALRWIHMLGADGNLKPENILLTDSGLKVDDPYFLNGRTMIPPEHGSFPLADRYLAPEQLEDEHQDRKESDIYALALILGEILVGKPVRPAVALSDQGPFFSPELDDVYLKATNKEPSARYESVTLFWDAVRQVFRVPAEEFGAGRTPVAFIPAALTESVRRAKASTSVQSAATPAATPASQPPAAPVPPVPVTAQPAAPEPPVVAAAQPAPPVPPVTAAAQHAAPTSPTTIAFRRVETEIPVELPDIDVEIEVESAPVPQETLPAEPAAPFPAPTESARPAAPVQPPTRSAQPADTAPVEQVPPPVPTADAEIDAGRTARFGAELQPLELEIEPLPDADEKAYTDRDRAVADEMEATLPEVRIPDFVVPEEEMVVLEDVRDVKPFPLAEEPGQEEPGVVVEAVEEPPVPTAAVGAEEDHELVAEIEKIIEQTKDLPVVEETPEQVPEAEEISEVIEADEEAVVAEAEEIEEGEIVVEAAEEATAVEVVDEIPTEAPAVVEPPAPQPPTPPPQPSVMAPSLPFSVDGEFWAYKGVEEDRDLDAVMETAGYATKQDEDIVLLGEEPEPAPVAPPRIAQLEAPPAAAQALAPEAPAAGAPATELMYQVPSPPKPTPARPATKKAPPVVVSSRRPVGKPAAGKTPKAAIAVMAFLVVAALAAIGVILISGDKKADKNEGKTAAQTAAAAESEGASEAAKSAKLAEDAKKAEAAKAAEAAAQKAAEAKAAADAEAAKKGAEAKMAETAKAAADARNAEEERKAKEAETAKADAAKKNLDAQRQQLQASFKEAETKVADLSTIAALSDTVATQAAALRAEFDALDKKEQDKQKKWGELLAATQAQAKGVADSRTSLTNTIQDVSSGIAAAADATALAAFTPKKDEIAKQSQEASASAIALVKAWNETTYQRKAAALDDLRKRLPAKANEWRKVARLPEADAVTALSKRLDEGVKALSAQPAPVYGDTVQAAVEASTKAAENLAALDKMVLDAKTELDREVTAAAVELTPEQLAQKKELDEINAKAGDSMEALRKLANKLKARSDEWKKAGNPEKSKEVTGIQKEVEKIRDSLFDVRSFVKKADLAGAKVSFQASQQDVEDVTAKANKSLAEAVVKATAPVDVAVDAKKGLKAQLEAMACLGGMKKIIADNPKAKADKAAPALVAYCIDYHEYPGQGRTPKTGVSWAAANAACTAVGKRLCESWEWRRGCGGKYPYGKTYDPEKCNTVGADGVEKPVLSAGSKSGCKSPYGLYDMVGNVAEWTADQSVAGGDCNKTGEDATCGRSSKRFGGSPYVGFRCCADPSD